MKRNEEQDVEIERLKSLITELADALEGGASVEDFDCTKRLKLILKARAVIQESHTGSEK